MCVSPNTLVSLQQFNSLTTYACSRSFTPAAVDKAMAEIITAIVTVT